MTELGGGGTATARSAAIAIRGGKNLLRHNGILAGEVETDGGSQMLAMQDDACFHFATVEGLIHPLCDLGDEVVAGRPIAQVWPVDRTGVALVESAANRDGLLAARHFPGLVQCGDCVAVIASGVDIDDTGAVSAG
ncbi:hypothetical protein [Tropicimonas aquimaris]